MVGRLGLLGQRLCTNRRHDEALVGFAHPGQVLVERSSTLHGSCAAPVLRRFASPPLSHVETTVPSLGEIVSRNVRTDRPC
jgi:hypothetical protein